MHFYVDESGHTGPALFDKAQPMLYYGVLCSSLNVDILAESTLARIRKELGVERLHAAELGNGRLVQVIDKLVMLQTKLDLRFDLYRVAKPDHAIISFFDQVFDHGVNPAITWTGYWTPLRYVLLLKVAYLFDEGLAKLAWKARISAKNDEAQAGMKQVCQLLRSRIDELPDARSRQLIGDALLWAENNAAEISYNVPDKKAILQVAPNMIGFQSVLHGIADRLKKTKRKAAKIVVDQQSQFNKSQKTLAEFYAEASGIVESLGPGMPLIDYRSMPAIPIDFASSKNSAGLELVDIYLWIFKRAMEHKELAPELYILIHSQLARGRSDEISLKALANRWSKWFEKLPELDEMSSEQITRGNAALEWDERRRSQVVEAMRVGLAKIPKIGMPI